jgi:hypothetical protein
MPIRRARASGGASVGRPRCRRIATIADGSSTVVAGGVIGERGLELGGHEARVAGSLE